MLEIPKEDERLLLELIREKRLSKNLIIELVKKALDIRYQNRITANFRDELSDLIKRYANDKRNFK